MASRYPALYHIVIGLACGLLLAAVWEVDGAKGFKFNSLNCEILNKSLAEFKVCKIHFQNRKSVLTMRLQVNTYIDNCILRLKIMQRQNGWRPFFYDKKTDICEFLANPKKYVIPYSFFNYAKRYHNIRHKCPYNSSDFITVDNVEARADEILSIFPLDVGEYGLFSYWYVDGKLVAYLNGSMIYTDYSKVF